MQFRDHPGVQGKRDAYPFDPRLLKIDSGYNVRDLDAADERVDLDELKESIRSNGVRVPLEVRLVDEDVFIVAGHRRHKAVMELIGEGEEIKAVPVMPEPKHTSEVDRILNLVISNSGKPLKPLEVAEVVRRLIAFGWDKAQIAKRVGWKSAASVTQHLELLALPEPVKEQVREGDISATEANKLVKTSRPEVDPKFAADLIKANKEENKRLGVGKKNNNKVTAKTLKRDQPKAAPAKADTQPAPAQQTFTAEDEAAATQGKTSAPVVVTYDDLKKEAPLASGLPATTEPEAATHLPLSDETPPADQPRTMETVLHEVATITAPRPRSSNRIDELLLEFISVDANALASMHARLNREHDEALVNEEHTVEQLHLIHAVEAIGSLRFPDAWEQAKGNSELAQVA